MARKGYSVVGAGAKALGDSFKKQKKTNSILEAGAKALGNSFNNMQQPFVEKTKNQIDVYNAFASMLQNNGVKDNLRSGFEANKRAINGGFDNSARQYYVHNRQNENELPEQLSNLGVSGGATESALLKLQSAYGSNLQKNESDRNSQLANAESAYNSDLANYESNLQSQLANAYMQQARAQIEDDQSQMEYDRAMQQAKEQERQSRSLSTRNNNVQKNIARRERQGYKVKTWTDKYDGKLHYQITGKKKVSNGGTSSGNNGNVENSRNGGSNGPKEIKLPKTLPVANGVDYFANVGIKNVLKDLVNGKLTEKKANQKLIFYGAQIKGNKVVKLTKLKKL